MIIIVIMITIHNRNNHKHNNHNSGKQCTESGNVCSCGLWQGGKTECWPLNGEGR